MNDRSSALIPRSITTWRGTRARSAHQPSAAGCCSRRGGAAIYATHSRTRRPGPRDSPMISFTTSVSSSCATTSCRWRVRPSKPSPRATRSPSTRPPYLRRCPLWADSLSRGPIQKLRRSRRRISATYWLPHLTFTTAQPRLYGMSSTITIRALEHRILICRRRFCRWRSMRLTSTTSLG